MSVKRNGGTMSRLNEIAAAFLGCFLFGLIAYLAGSSLFLPGVVADETGTTIHSNATIWTACMLGLIAGTIGAVDAWRITTARNRPKQTDRRHKR